MPPDPVWKPDRPRAVLLATDLGSRCDRALDRAVQLARLWDARLVALSVIEPSDLDGDRAAAARGDIESSRLRIVSRLRRDIQASGLEVPFELHVGEGHVGQQVLSVAEERGCSLVVTGVARDEPFGRLLPGSSVDWLARNSPLPLLAVRDRVHGPYSRMIVASDFSEAARHGLDTACALLPQAEPTLVHAYDVPFLGLMDTRRDIALRQARETALLESRAFLAGTGRGALPVAIEHGDPARRIAAFARDQDADLVVAATHGRSAMFHLLIGSVAREILAQASCDILLVPVPPARGGQ